ncbi:MAG: hypothetical protein RLZZ148_2785, partial [Cyanobacteriota bacterium]|jgi:hypothetical protein
MNTWIGYIIKIVLWSLLGSLIIKYVAPGLDLAPTEVNALIGVLIFPLGMGIALALRKS